VAKWIRTTVILSALILVFAGCSTEEQVAKQDETRGDGGVVESEDASDASRSRGVSVEEEEEEERPTIVVGELEYEWRHVPQRGLYVRILFVNPRETYARARGRVFLIAESSVASAPTTGIYPWDAELDGDEPTNYRDGANLLFRVDQEVRAFLPYTAWDGYYDSLRLLVFEDDGDVLIDRLQPLEITGEPSGIVKVQPELTL